MSAKFDRLVKGFSDAIRTPKTKTTPYDTVATVTRTDGDTVYVHIPGGVDETPVSKTMDCKSGDKVQVRVSGGRAWVTGNATAPPTDDKKANQALTEVNEVEQNVTILNNVVAENIEATNARFGYVEADTAKIHSLTADQLSATVGYIDDLTAGNITASDIVADHGTIDNLDANYAHISNGFIDNADIKEANVENLTSKYAHITQGVIDNAKIGYADVNGLSANYAQINLANVNNAWIENGVVKDAAITSAQILGVSANKLTAGTIDASDINVANLRAKNLIVEKMNGQPILGGYELVNKNSTGYSGKNPSNEGWYEYSNGTFVASTDTTVNTSKAYYKDGTQVALYDQAYIDGLENDLNQRIDGAVEVFSGSVVPTLVNYPAVDWSSTQMASHVGNVYYLINEASDENGYCYRFTYDNTTSSYKWVLIKDSDVTKALADISDLQDFQSDTTSWITETDEGLETIRTNHTSLSGVVNKTVKSSTQLWFTKANTTAPTAPTSEVTSDSTSGNAWRRVVPTYNASYPYYFYCWQYKYVDNTFGWSAVIYDQATTESEERARTGVANAATADGKAVSAQNTANANIKSSVQLWFTKANTTAPSKPTSQVTNNSATGSNSYNKWNLVVPVYNSSYPYYYYCYQQQKGDGTYQWSDVVYDQATSEAMKKAQEALPASTFTTFETTTFKDVKDTVDEQSSTITTLSSRVDTKADSSTVTTLSNTVSSVSQTATSNSSKLSQLTTTLGTNADGTTKTNDIMHRMSAQEQDLSGFKTTVSQTYTTKTEFEGLEIGGRNTYSHESTEVAPSSGMTATKDESIHGVVGTQGNTSGNYRTIRLPHVIDENGYWTVSVYVKTQNPVVFTIDICDTNPSPNKSITTTTEYQYFTVTVDVTREIDSIYHFVDFNIPPGAGDYWLKDIKVEKGNKATDWSPCPDDYSTTTQMNSSITQKASEITLEVSETYTTKEDFSNLEIGGRNLLLNTGDLTKWNKESGVTVVWDSNKEAYKITVTKEATSTSRYGIYQDLVIDPDSDYTFSSYMFSDSGAECFIGLKMYEAGANHDWPSDVQTTATVKKRYSKTKTASSTQVECRCYIGMQCNGTSTTYVGYFTLPKFEKGNKSTDWSPAPEDVETRITSAESSITQTADSIVSLVANNDTYTKPDGTTATNTIKSAIKQNADNIELRVEKSGVIASINASTESSGGSAVKISADKVNIEGAAIFTGNGRLSQTSLNNAYDAKGSASTAESNAKSYTDTATNDMATNTGVAGTYATQANAVSEEQYIYISKASGTTSVSGTTTWVSVSYDSQNTWTTKRPTYNSSYPVLFIAKQKKTVSGTVTCTTPVKDDTTTVIDGGHITTGTIDAARLNVSDIIANGSIAVINDIPTNVTDLDDANNYSLRRYILPTEILDENTGNESHSVNGEVVTVTRIGDLTTSWGVYADVPCKPNRFYSASMYVTAKSDNCGFIIRFGGDYGSGVSVFSGLGYTNFTGIKLGRISASSSLRTSATQTYIRVYIASNIPNDSLSFRDLCIIEGNEATIIDGTQIVTGTVSANAINASSGTFDVANIPNLNADKITAGTISVGIIPDDALNSNIQIGGRNLLARSLFVPVDRGPDAIDSDGYVTDSSPTNDGRSWGYSYCEWKLSLGAGTYTLSWETAVATSESSSNMYVYDSNSTSLGSYNHPFETIGIKSLMFTLSANTNIGIEAKVYGAKVRFKLEKGNKATDWTPAPNDLETQWEIPASLILNESATHCTVSVSGKNVTVTRITSGSKYGCYYDMPCKPNTFYSASIRIISGTAFDINFGGDYGSGSVWSGMGVSHRRTSNGKQYAATAKATSATQTYLRIYIASSTQNATMTFTDITVYEGDDIGLLDRSAYNASLVATNYVTEINSDGIWVTPQNKKPSSSSGATGTKIDGTGVGIYKDGNLASKFTGNGVNIYDSDGELASFTRETSNGVSYGKLALNHSSYNARTMFTAGLLQIDPYGNDVTAAQNASPTSGIYKTKLTQKGMYNNNNTTSVGSVCTGEETAAGSGTDCTTSTWTMIDAMGLYPGTWIITFGGAFASDARGMRYLVLDTVNSDSGSATREDIRVAPANGGQTSVHATRIVTISQNTTYYLKAYQNSGTRLAVSPVLKAVQIM